jgi:peptide/nickel transport system substrate-binding protein
MGLFPMILFSRKEQMAFLLILTLFLSFISSGLSTFGTNFYHSRELDNSEIIPHSSPRSTSSKLNAISPQELRVIAWNFDRTLCGSWSFDSLVTANETSSPGSFIFNTLVDYDFETGEIVPSLAQYWVVTNDSKNWLFILREDVYFHDGSKFDASVVKFNFDRLINPNHSAYVSDLANELDGLPLESVDVISDYRVMFTFSNSFAPFINVHASTIEIVSPNSFQGGTITNPIGTGPYKFAGPTNDSVKQVFTFQRYSNYFRGIPPFEQVEYSAYFEFIDFRDALLNNEADLSVFGAHLLEKFNNNFTHWNMTSTDAGIIRFGWLNQQREEFKNPKVRQAINYAVDKVEYTKHSHMYFEMYGYFMDESFISNSFIPSFHPYWDSSIPGYPYNVTKANELLDEAGYPRGSNGYRFSINITIPEGSFRAHLIAENLDSVGINCSIISLPWEFYHSNFTQLDYELTLQAWSDLYDPSFISDFLHSNGTYNTGGYSNLGLDYLLDLAIESPIPQEQEYYYKQIQIKAHADIPYLLLPESTYYYPRAHHVASSVRFSRNGRPSFNYSSDLDAKIATYSNITVSSKAVYFPFADVLFSQSDNQDFIVDLEASRNLEIFLPSFDGTGKFYQINIDLQESNSSIRFYYDPDEIIDLTIIKIYRYNPNTTSWFSLEILSSNESLRYFEVNLPSGKHILSFGKEISLITYKLVPIISILFGSVLLFAVITIFYNQKRLNQYKRRYNL